MKTRGDKRVVKLDFFLNAFLEHLKKISTISIWCIVIPIGSHLAYT